jgi:ribosomal protein L14E/L6E/L27E
VLATEEEYAVIANGRERRIEKPKRKKLKHLRYVGTQADRVSVRLKNDERVSNSELRKALAEFSSEKDGVQGGM